MNVQQPVTAILLAAGAGSRFGGEKLLHPLDDGVAIAAHSARNLIAAGIADVVAVLRPGDFPLADMLEQEGCYVTFCADAVRGMGHSLAHGIANAREAKAWIVALADMPRVRPRTIEAIRDALESGATIAAPTYRGERGHPVGFARSLERELSTLSGDTGARRVLDRHANEITLIDCDDPGIHADIDRRSDLKT